MNFENKEEITSMIKFFYHSPLSKLPIPDFSGIGNPMKKIKTEPHFLHDDCGGVAENYLKTCNPGIIKKIIEGNIPYLFWATKCQNNSVRDNKQIIGGYLEIIDYENKKCTVTTDKEIKKPILTGGPHITIYGRGHFCEFEKAIPTKDIFGKNLDRIDFLHRSKIDQETTMKLLEYFMGIEDISEECAKEITKLDKKGISCYPEICSRKNRCSRYLEHHLSNPDYGTQIKNF